MGTLYLLLLVDLEGGKNQNTFKNLEEKKMDLFLGDSFEENMSFYHGDGQNMPFSFGDAENEAFPLGDEENMMDLLERSMQEIGQSEFSFEDRQNSYSLDNNNNLIDTENILQNYDDSNEEDENMYTLVNPIKIEPETTDLQMDRPDVSTYFKMKKCKTSQHVQHLKYNTSFLLDLFSNY